MYRFYCVLGSFSLAIFLSHSGPCLAADSTPESLDELAIELINPAGGLVSIFNVYEYNSFQGYLPESGDQSKGAFTITPSVPFALSNGNNIIVRASIPISTGTPAYVTDERDYADWLIRQRADTISREENFIQGHGHLDDISIGIAYGSTRASGWITTFGIEGVVPSSQDGSIERHQYLLGPEIALGKITDWGIIGATAKHLTNVADDADKETIDYDYKLTSLKFFFAFTLGNGWQIISNPTISYDWEGDSDNKLLVPIGGGVSKTMRLGRMPMKMDLEVYNFVISPDAFGPDWLMSFTFTPIFSQWSP